MKKIICLLFSFMFFVSCSFASTNTYQRTRDNLRVSDGTSTKNVDAILSTPSVNANEKIYDFAELFSSEEENSLYGKVMDFIEKSGMDMAIVTIDENPKSGYDSDEEDENYADDFYDYNDFGTGNTKDGVLFLINVTSRYMYMCTTGEAILYYNDGRISLITGDAVNGITKYEYDGETYENFYGAACNFIDSATKYYEMGIPSSNVSKFIDDDGELRNKSDYTFNEDGTYTRKLFTSESLIGTSIISLIIALIATLNMKGKHKTIAKATTASNYMKDEKIKTKEDVFLTTHTTSVYVPPASSSGGSSTHHSSSGRSHGGGGRHF